MANFVAADFNPPKTQPPIFLNPVGKVHITTTYTIILKPIF